MVLVQSPEAEGRAGKDACQDAHNDAGYVVIVPMIADEHDYDLLDFMKDNLEMLPKWYGKRYVFLPVVVKM
ncbi:MAG: hypothetical protein J7J98_06430 [candidate division Zixibacteria bacterium]|nr:hypothetical protein [candidate division Zixibacteria bacterium]